MTSPSSTALWPDTLCPPPRTAISSPSAVANRTAAATSCVDVQRASAAGRLSMSAFQTVRASSKSACPGSTTAPAMAARNAVRSREVVLVMGVSSPSGCPETKSPVGGP